MKNTELLLMEKTVGSKGEWDVIGQKERSGSKRYPL